MNRILTPQIDAVTQRRFFAFILIVFIHAGLPGGDLAMSAGAVLFQSAIWDSRTDWTAYVYPNGNDLTDHIKRGDLDSLEQCRVAASELIEAVSSLAVADYEYGQGCKLDDQVGVNICEAAIR